MTPFVTRRPRTAAALAFGAAACALTSIWFLPSVLDRRDPAALAIFVISPTIASAIAGALGRPRIGTDGGARRALLAGAGIATMALILNAPMVAILHRWTARGATDVLGLSLAVIGFSLLAIWPVAAVAGAGVGWVLSRLAARGGASASRDGPR